MSSNENEVVQQIEAGQIPLLPKPEYLKNLGNKLTSNTTALRILYNSTLSCAITSSIFQQIEIKRHLQSLLPLDNKAALDIDAVPDNRLFSAVFDAVGIPPCIKAAAFSYIQHALKYKKYAAVHWRYNAKDWIKQSCNGFKKKLPWYKSVCDSLDKIKPVHIAQAIAFELKRMLEINSVAQKVIPIYIAVPFALETFRNNVYDELMILNHSKTFMKPSENLTIFLYDNYHQCWEENEWNVTEEIESLCEMEIMAQSTWFFYSVSSSWSANVRKWRTSLQTSQRQFETDIFASAVNQLKIVV